MPIERFNGDVSADRLRSLMPAPPTAAVAEILTAVKSGGDAALRELNARFDSASIGRQLRVEPSQIAAARGSLDAELLAALELAIANVTTVARHQLSEDVCVDLPQGHAVRYRSLPVTRAAAYVPGGRGSYPSTAVMCLATARAAGVDEICVLSPPRADGEVDGAVLAVCSLIGVEEVYAVGGAQAIAAAAYGTETIDAVGVVVGPGNSYVQEAKRQLFGQVGIDSVAGPSELVIVADGSADPHVVSLDLLAQGEHGPDSLVVLIATDGDLLASVAEECSEIGAVLALVEVSDLPRAVALADDLAPEHMQLMVEPAQIEGLAAAVRHAGALLTGHNGATAFADYVIGSNHVLPTGGAARHASALSVATFRRRMAQIEVPDAAVGALGEAGARIARAEGFTWHAKSMEARNSE
jgi:histidinol dehydrogenase